MILEIKVSVVGVGKQTIVNFATNLDTDDNVVIMKTTLSKTLYSQFHSRNGLKLCSFLLDINLYFTHLYTCPVFFFVSLIIHNLSLLVY